jgi:release factor H-coupled RctB family protein
MTNASCWDTAGVPVTLFASASTWIEGPAVDQLRYVAGKPGMVLAAAFPDLHPGRGYPIGASFLVRDRIYPTVVGNDIGCGIGLWQTDLPRHKLKLDRWLRRLDGLDNPWDGNQLPFLLQHGLTAESGDPSLGTIGGGNHFAELTQVKSVMDVAGFSASGLDAGRLFLLVHSGSRGLGELVLRSHVDHHADGFLMDGTPEADAYLARHDLATRWAKANRHLIAHRFLEALSAGATMVCDTLHNGVARVPEGWLHRKGASEADKGIVVIAGSRGAPSYLVRPLKPARENGWSIAHGAGRKWKRGDVKARLSNRLRPDQLRQTELGSRVVCGNKELLYEEAPQAYKDIETVISDLEANGLIAVLAILQPVITYKCGEE